MPPGAVLYSSRAPIGYAAIAAGPVCTNQGFKSFVPREVIVSDLLYWFLTYATPDIRKLGSGTTFPELSKAKAREIRIALPPLNEQRRIVAAIEEHLSRLDAADASLAAALRRLAPLRDHTFMAACPDGSPTVPLGELLREPLRNGHSAKASPNGTVRTLTLSAVTRGEFVEANTKLTAADPAKIERLWLEPGDVLIERSNTPELVGTAALFRGPRNWAIFPDLLIRVRVGDGLLPEFLEIVLKSRPTRRYFQAAAQGIAGSMPKIDQAVVERLEVSVPPLEEQRRIVQEVEERLSRIDAMRASIERAQRRSRALRAAILERAFRGELVPQDPSDEPAEALLARIRECQPKAETRVR
jgi:type I restriction enzyme S subunit